MKESKKERTINMIILNLEQKEAQAILSGAETFFAELKQMKQTDMAIFWRILFKDFEKGIKKAGEQYDKQIEEKKEKFIIEVPTRHRKLEPLDHPTPLNARKGS